MPKTLVLMLLFPCLTVLCKSSVSQENDNAQPKIGVKLSVGQLKTPFNLTVQIQNLGSDDISIGANEVSLFATKPTLNWPLRLWLGPPTKKITPNIRANGPPEVSDVDAKQPHGLQLKPGQSFLYELNIQKIMNEREWSWTARPGPPKSPIINRIGDETFEPIALWSEIIDKNRWEGGLCSRPIMLYPEKYIGKTASDFAKDKNRRKSKRSAGHGSSK